jgi:shikimate dehydrogenase
VSLNKYGLLGKSLAHSFSKDFFTHFFLENNLSGEYDLIQLANEQHLASFFKREIKAYKGLNVTVPYKECVMPLLDEVSEEALAIGAVNTIKVSESGRTIGYNTDAFGFHQSIKPFLNFNHHRALLIGTGGAAKAVAFVLEKIGLEVFYISRNPKGDRVFGYSEINKNMVGSCKLIVNCTPVGMYPKMNETLDFPHDYLTSDHLVIDLIYNPEQTIFLQKAVNRGSIILNGKSMLQQQALKSWKIWSSSF